MGSATTLPHLMTLGEPLRELAARRTFVLHVVCPVEVSIPGVTVTCAPWSAESEVRELHRFDIGVMPLPDDRWARGKCGAKLLQYMGVGVPGVASSVGVNTEIITDGVNGFLAGTEDEWVEKLTALIDSPSLRVEMGAAGRRTVEERYSAQLHANAMLEIFKRAREL
jgi:glycosyltransferase involved in cell wall biosynthesis